MVIFPLYMACSEGQYALNMQMCPWDQDNTMLYISLIFKEVIQILLSILSVTFFNSLFYFISHGWNITTFDMYRTNRAVCTNVFILGASLYLLMLAKSYTSDGGAAVQSLFILVMISVYGALCYYLTKNLGEKIRQIRNVKNDEEFPEAALEALNLKTWQCTEFRKVILLYYSSNILYEIIVMAAISSESFDNDEYTRIWIKMVFYAIDLVNFSYLLWIFRPRK